MHWEPFYSPAVYALLGLAAGAVLIAARIVAVSDKNRWWFFLVLRGIVFASLIGLLLNPIARRETVLPPRPPTVAVLVDCSQSMSLGRQQSRIDRAKQVLDQAMGDRSDRSETQFRWFRFGHRLKRVPGLREYGANEDASNLADALEALPARTSDRMPQSLILFSDGAVSDVERFEEIAAAYRQIEVPIHSFVPDQDAIRGDVAITRLVVPTRVTAGDRTTVRATIECRGYGGERAVVSVRPVGRPKAAPIASTPVTLVDGEITCDLVVATDTDHDELQVGVPLFAEEAVTINNTIPFRLSQRKAKLKVLYMEGTSGQEYRWLQDALTEDPNIECVSMVVNTQYSNRPTLQRVNDRYRGYPATRAELMEYDVVICSDISRGAFTPEQIQWTFDLVSQRGGGFAMIGGHTSFGSGGWDRTPWEKLIPFDMTNRRDYSNQSFGVEVPAEIEDHPIWQLLDDPGKNRAALDAMPRFLGTNLIERVKPAATLLGQTETAIRPVGVMPVFACESFGRGRTFAMSTDSTVGWGRYFESQWGEGDNRYFRKFWRNVVRWLAENSRASQQRLFVRTDQIIYQRGEPIEVFAEALNKELKPTTDYTLTVKLAAQSPVESVERSDANLSSGRIEKLQPVANQPQYRGSMTAALADDELDLSQPMQQAHLVVTAWQGENAISTESVRIQILNRSEEWLDASVDADLLRSISRDSGGSILAGSDDLVQLISRYQASPGEVLFHSLPLWDHWLLWSAFLAALGLEWGLRRRMVIGQTAAAS